MSNEKSYLIAGFLIGILVSVSVFAVMVPELGNDGFSHGTTVLKLAHSLDQQHPVHQAMEFMAKQLAEKSNGTFQIEIFPNGQLGEEVECIEQLQSGVLDMTKTSTAALEAFADEFAVFGVPFLFRDEQHAWNVYDGPLGKKLLLAGTKVGLRGLCFYDAGARSFYTAKKPIMTPDDLVGQKIRVQESKTSMAMVEALGGSPTPISFGELYTALQTSMVDGAENNPPSLYTSRHFEVCKNYSLDEHTRVPDILLISEPVWEGLSKQQQKWLQEAADESAVFERQLWQKKTAEILALLEKEGVKIYRPDRAPFVAKVKPMLDAYKGSKLGDLIDQILETP